MRFMRLALWILMGAAFLGFTSTFALESTYTARAQRVQPVRIDTSQHNPLGPITIDIGEPSMMIVDDPAAFLKNKTATGLPKLDIDYLKAHGESALQLQNIQSVIGMARLGCILSALVAGIGLFLLSFLRSDEIGPEP